MTLSLKRSVFQQEIEFMDDILHRNEELDRESFDNRTRSSSTCMSNKSQGLFQQDLLCDEVIEKEKKIILFEYETARESKKFFFEKKTKEKAIVAIEEILNSLKIKKNK